MNSGQQRTSLIARDRPRLAALPGFLAYTMVSGLALLVDYVVYWIAATHWGVALPTAASLGYLVGLALSYILVRGGVFRDGWLRSRPKMEMTLYAVSGLLGLSLTYVTTTAVVWFMGEHLVVAKLCALVVSFVGVYAFRAKIVFRRPKPS